MQRTLLVALLVTAASGCDASDGSTATGSIAELHHMAGRPVLRSEQYQGSVGPVAVIEPTGLGPLAGIELPPPSIDGTSATTVAHALPGRTMVHAAPDFSSERITMFRNPDDRGASVVFQVIGPVVDGWVEVRLPIRPNGTTGWIRARQLVFTTNPYRIDVDVDRFELTITRTDEVVLTAPVGIGTGETPTPHGDFYLTELLRPSDPTGIYGPYAYGLSGFSDTLSSFNGGPGAIGIHGTNEPELLGTNVSHGCVRVDNAVIEQLTTFLPLGTPVTIG
jgi:lipoprotein-anchoring transpeptidase ErfK/SrfK